MEELTSKRSSEIIHVNRPHKLALQREQSPWQMVSRFLLESLWGEAPQGQPSSKLAGKHEDIKMNPSLSNCHPIG